MNATNTPSSERRQSAYYEAGRAVAACCLGIRFSRATISQERGSIGTIDAANLVVSDALNKSPLVRQQLIDRLVQSLLTGAVVAKRSAASSESAASFLSEADRDCIEESLRHHDAIAGETARNQHLAMLLEQAEVLAGRSDFRGAVDEVAAELLNENEFGYRAIMQILVRHAVRAGD
jgi:hypothetical protein